MSGLLPAVFASSALRAVLAPAALSNSITPYAVVMGLGFLIGVAGHVIRSRMMIVTGIIIVGALGAYMVFGLAKIY